MPTMRIVDSGVAIPAPAMFPSAVRTPSAIVLSFSTVPDGWPGGMVYVTRSRDNGATWDPPQPVGLPLEGEEAALGAVGLARLSDGTLLLPFNGVHWAGMEGESRVISLGLARSTDDGKTWAVGDRVDIDYFMPAVYGEILELEDGTLLWPIWGQRTPEEKWRSVILASDDVGRTWTLRGTVAYDQDARLDGEYADTGNSARTDDPSEIFDPDFRPHGLTDGFSETSVVLLPDGRLLAILRQQGVGRDSSLLFFRSWSSDLGVTWTPHESTGFSGMSPLVHRLPDDRLLLAYRRCAPPGSGIEPGVDVRVGSVDGSAWSDAVALVSPTDPLTAEYQCGYPTIVADGEGVRIFFYSYATDSGRIIAWNQLDISSNETLMSP